MASKALFKTAYDKERPEYYTDPGNPIQDIYGYEINKYGQKVLVKTGETDLYAKIQESLEETKIENILKRVAMGDNSVMRPDGIYADLTEAPSSLLEARQQMQKLENMWNTLPVDIKREYNFSLDEYIGSAGTNKWMKDMGLLNDPITPEETKTEKQEGSEKE